MFTIVHIIHKYILFIYKEYKRYVFRQNVYVFIHTKCMYMYYSYTRFICVIQILQIINCIFVFPGLFGCKPNSKCYNTNLYLSSVESQLSTVKNNSYSKHLLVLYYTFLCLMCTFRVTNIIFCTFCNICISIIIR